jgi:hypothetical protein
MRISSLVKRVAVAAGVTAAVVGGSTVAASASTIPNGQLQICSQGNYWSYIHVLSAPVPGGNGMTTQTFASTLVAPGTCWKQPVNTLGAWVQVDVVGLYNTSGHEFYIGSQWYNSSVAGLGIGAEGTTTSPFIWTW